MDKSVYDNIANVWTHLRAHNYSSAQQSLVSLLSGPSEQFATLSPPIVASRFSEDNPNSRILLDFITSESPSFHNESDINTTVDHLSLLDFIIGIVLAIVTLCTVIGNALVIAAILRERHLRSVGNYLVFSLAVADLMVACLVMPLSAVYVVTNKWTFGAEFCDLWTMADVLCCTASILHLLAIAVVSKSLSVDDKSINSNTVNTL